MDDSLSDGLSPSSDPVQTACRRKDYLLNREDLPHWIIRHVKCHGAEHPQVFGKPEAHEYLSHLVTERNVTGSTQNQSLNAPVSLHLDVFGTE